ncbi:hypothetical protein [Halorhodospira halochloris]|nr:hypothetical protein [Halorhodospira halochloris]MCG5548687.1 hypothetical protein [Halorhodospira halochloris]
MDPSLEASWRHPWRQDLHTGADMAPGRFLEVPIETRRFTDPGDFRS